MIIFFKYSVKKPSNLNQPYLILSVSPWPMMTSVSLLVLLFGIINFLNFKDLILLINGLILVILNLFQWFRDIIRETTYKGGHTFEMRNVLMLGMMLFIVSEVFFFISFFWSFFHFSLNPNIELGLNWPPKSLMLFNPMGIALLNTLILLSSGITLTWSHMCLIKHDYCGSFWGMFLTLILGMYFIVMQLIEYSESCFSMSDSVYGSIFFLMTGFHGLHVLGGMIFLLITFLRLVLGQFNEKHSLGYEFASWYWHFVDVVWLFLYLFIYWWIY